MCDASDPDDDNDGLDDPSDPCPLDASNDCPASAPTAIPQAITTVRGAAVSVTLSASDPDGDPLSFAIATPPAHGVLEGTGAQRTYTPAPDFIGADEFSFTANDGTHTSAPAPVSILVRADHTIHRDGFE